MGHQNIWTVSGRLARPANFVKRRDGGAALLGTLKSVAEVRDRHGDTETRTTYVEFAINNTKMAEALNNNPMTEGAVILLVGRAYKRDGSEYTDRETGEVKMGEDRLAISVEDATVGHKAEYQGH